MIIKKRVITLVLCFALIFVLVGAVDSKLKEDKKSKCDFSAIDTGIADILGDVNANTLYTEFIANSGYDAVKLLIDKTNAYYFVYNAETKKVEQMESAEEDFTIKVSCKQINKVFKEYDSDSPKLNRAILNRVPMKVKSDLINQCFETPWCLNKILGK